MDIVTWGKLPFEFVHFNDRELANAMLGIASSRYRSFVSPFATYYGPRWYPSVLRR